MPSDEPVRLPDLRDFLRRKDPPRQASLVVRGGPDSLEKLRSHAARLRRTFMLDGRPVLGISVYAALDDIGPASLEGIKGGRLSTYRWLHVATVERIVDAGFWLLPTFARPHMTLLVGDLGQVGALMELLGRPQPNPRYGELAHRRRRRPR